METELLLEAASVVGWMAMPAAAVLATATLLSAAYLWLRHPATSLIYLQNLGFYMLGMSIKYTDVNGLRICYAEKGKAKEGAPSMLLIHGFTASKDMWLPLIPGLMRNHHIVVMDLPGHGSSQIPDKDFDLSIPGLAKFVHQFTTEIGLNSEPFHLIGLSLGGAISGLYGALYPQELSLLTLACPAMITPEETNFIKQVKEGRCELLPDTVEGVQHMFKLCVYNNHLLPLSRHIMRAFLEVRKPSQKFFWRLFAEITKSMEDQFNELMRHVTEITCPTQIIWGTQDEILHVSGARVLQKALPKCVQIDVLDKCGHLLCFDCPVEMANRVKKFRQ